MLKIYKLVSKWKQAHNGLMPQLHFRGARQPRGKGKRTRVRLPVAIINGKAIPLRKLRSNVNVIYRINVPRLRRQWQCRRFDLRVPAYVCKNNMVQPLLSWELLDHIMMLPVEQGTAEFQAYVNNMLQLPHA
ncbi:PREDICTED: uncharacterized protein LOC108618662 [Drosophila arizonae]|uniref:Uncharacterized protein LOC108618662 n=1 Tax=Drosophila arizonae TaxID=7263 RepID=A0ABM1PSQ6_DROAR|nr:PREDICTED: uncharacterized protein LOC108618662 [Drosophila arizonae]